MRLKPSSKNKIKAIILVTCIVMLIGNEYTMHFVKNGYTEIRFYSSLAMMLIIKIILDDFEIYLDNKKELKKKTSPKTK